MKKLPTIPDKDWQDLRSRLARSKYKAKFALSEQDVAYAKDRGVELLRRHAEDFVRQRLAPAKPRNDGRQTPLKGHPVFIAQHATGTCCRKCLQKWHGIAMGVELTEKQVNSVLAVIFRWLEEEMPDSLS